MTNDYIYPKDNQHMRIRGWWRIHMITKRILRFVNTSLQKAYTIRIWYFKKVVKGFNIIGFARGDFGLSEHLRMVTHAIHTSGVSFCVIDSGDAGAHSQRNSEMQEWIRNENPHNVNLFCYNADSVIQYMKSPQGHVAQKKHYNIGYGHWELSEYPTHWKEQHLYLQEIWAPSGFVGEVMRKATSLPVIHMPMPVDFKLLKGFHRDIFRLPQDRFLFLFNFDMSSFIGRKNPEGCLKAFVLAFPLESPQQVGLVIKVNRIKSDIVQTHLFNTLLQHTEKDPRIHVVDEVLERPYMLGLISVCDAYISMHRAEGFGLGMAEAMKMGKTVIATNYSGNTEFMNSENSCLVDYTLIEVDKEDYVFVEDGALWADPDVGHAAYFMKKVYDDQSYRDKKGSLAQIYMDRHHSFRIAGERYRRRLEEIMRD